MDEDDLDFLGDDDLYEQDLTPDPDTGLVEES